MTGRKELTSAAARYTRPRRNSSSTVTPTSASGQKWQAEAWSMFDRVPEVRFVCNWVGNAMSGARLIAGRRGADGTIEAAPDGHLSAELVTSIAGGPDGQSQFLGDFGPHLVVPGEAWVIIRPVTAKTPASDAGAPAAVTGQEWHVLSTEEVTNQNGKMTAEIDGEQIEIPEYDPENPDDTAPAAIRVWDAHPRRRIEADSPVRSSLVILEELELLNAAVAAIARSRLTGRGVLLVPKGVRFPTAPGQADAEDDLIEIFMQVAETAIREPTSAAATVPIILEVPADAIGDIRLVQFDSAFDDIAIRLRDEAIRRFAAGCEIPAELILGLDSLNHWTAWMISAEGVRMGVEPRLALVCNALTTQWLRPLLEAENVEDAHEWLVWYDTSQLRVQANRSQTALEVFREGAISAKALRRETGFDESDAPGAEDQAPDDEQPNDEQPTAGAPESNVPVSETTAPPADQTSNGPADTTASIMPIRSAPVASPIAMDGVLAALDGLIYNALHSVGARLRTRPVCPRSERARAKEIIPVEMHTVYPIEWDQIDEWKLLDGAWTRVPEIARRYGMDAECLAHTLDDYTRALIAARLPHTYEDVPRLLKVSSCFQAAA
ncbi:hypothetical protein SUDANB1_05660 [Streptomyces sp. enrichment culture]|uniref:hypothetical protein n=1 Tax=Streptomyces sp. enrichment culture TaxID=1795815 RepID=UPI003F57E82A